MENREMTNERDDPMPGKADLDEAVSRMEALVAGATDVMRAEAEQMARTGEANLERLATKVTEAIIREILAQALNRADAGSGSNTSLNTLATGIAQAATRGARFR